MSELLEALGNVTAWKQDLQRRNVPVVDQLNARFFVGSANGWTFVVGDFELPSGRRGYDGAARKGKQVRRIPADLVERAVAVATGAVH